jgi:hypothetical protein
VSRPLDRLGERIACVVHPHGDVAHAVAVLLHVLGDANRLGAHVLAQGRGEHEADLALLQQIARPVAHAGLRASIAHELESERRAIEMRCLLGVADPELDEVGPVDREGVVRLGGGFERPCGQ